MNILIVTAGYSIFDAKGQLNSFLAYLTEKNLAEKGHTVKISDVTKDTWSTDREVEKLLWAETVIYITPIMWFNMPAPLVEWFDKVLLYKKTFIITDEVNAMGKLKDFVQVYSTSKELEKHIDFYLKHPEERLKRAKKGMKFVIEHHTFEERAKVFSISIQKLAKA